MNYKSTKAMRIGAWIMVIPILLFLLLAGGTKVLGISPLALERLPRFIIY